MRNWNAGVSDILPGKEEEERERGSGKRENRNDPEVKF